MELWHSELGGLRKGKSFWFSMRASWPCAKIKVYREMIVIKSLIGKVQLEKHEVEYIEEGKGIQKGIIIHHNNQNESEFILFFSFSLTNLLTKLEECGYKIRISE